MKYILYFVNLFLALVLVFIIVYPQIKAARVQEIQIVAYPDLSSFPVYVAQKKGFFKENKLIETIVYSLSREDPLTELKKGKFEVLCGFPIVNFLFSGTQDIANFRLLSIAYSDSSHAQTALFIRTKKKNPSIIDIKDGILMLPSWRKDAEFIRILLRKEKIKIDESKIIEYTGLLPIGEWNSSYIVGPGIGIFNDSSDIRLYKKEIFREIVEPYPYAGTFISQTGIYFKGKAIERFHKVWDKAVDFIQNPRNKEEVDSLLISYEKNKMNIENPKIYPLPFFLKKDEIQDLPLLKVHKWMRENELSFYEVDFSPLFLAVP